MSSTGPSRVALTSTSLAAASYAGDAQAAFWHGVELGRVEAAQRPTGLVVALEPGLLPADVERLAAAIRLLRGVVQVSPIARPSLIESVPGKMGGLPCIAGTRLTVAAVASLGSVERALKMYPYLTAEQAQAALDYDLGEVE